MRQKPPKRQNPPNARFWTYYNGGWVKLTLTPYQVLRHEYGQSHDEGWSLSETKWSYTIRDDGAYIVRTSITDGTDCDGRLTHTYIDACRVMLLRSDIIHDGDDGLSYPVPAWKGWSSSQRDYSAEMMGY